VAVRVSRAASPPVLAWCGPPFGPYQVTRVIPTFGLVPYGVSMTRIEPTIYAYFLRIVIHVLGL
jgi:hypothetical protein